MKVLSSNYWAEVNKLSSNNVWYLLLDLQVAALTNVYLTNNNEDVVFTYTGQTYTRFPFRIEPVRENIQGDVPKIKLLISNANLYLNSWIQDNNGFIGNSVTINLVNSSLLNEAPAVSETFTILEAIADNHNVSLSIGISSPINKRLPRDRYIANICRHHFKYPGRTDGRAERCDYIRPTLAEIAEGKIEYATCAHTLEDCRLRDNSHKYGGSPGVAEGIP